MGEVYRAGDTKLKNVDVLSWVRSVGGTLLSATKLNPSENTRRWPQCSLEPGGLEVKPTRVVGDRRVTGKFPDLASRARTQFHVDENGSGCSGRMTRYPEKGPRYLSHYGEAAGCCPTSHRERRYCRKGFQPDRPAVLFRYRHFYAHYR